MNLAKKNLTVAALVLTMIVTSLALPSAAFATDTGSDGTQTATKRISVGRTSGVRARALSTKSIKVSWSKANNATAYQVYRYNAKKKKYVKIATVKGRSYTNKKLKSNKKYAYRIKAYTNTDGKTLYGVISRKATAKTEDDQSDKIMNLAKKKIGCSYVSGASGPSRFDCSGFVYWVVKNSGADTVKVPRTSCAGLYSKLKKYSVGSSLSKAEYGDIIIFARGGRLCHTGFYKGSGKIVHAGSPRSGVCTGSVYELRRYSGQHVAAIIRLP